MLKRLRLKFMVMASLMLAFIGFGSLNEARAQGTLVCPDLPSNPGIVLLNVSGVGGKGSNFTDGLLGTIESFNRFTKSCSKSGTFCTADSDCPTGETCTTPGSANIAGLTWLTRDLDLSLTSFASLENILGLDGTTVTGSQLVSWWSMKNGRDTVVQVTNTLNPPSGFSGICSGDEDRCNVNADCAGTCSVTTTKSCATSAECPTGETCNGGVGVCTPATVNIHVRIIGENCAELRDFCDTLTPNDTVVYDLANLLDNSGKPINTGILAGHEGIILITPVDSCADKDAIRFDWLQGNASIKSNGIDEYGANVYARAGENFAGRCSSAPKITCVENSDCNPQTKNGTCTTLDGSGCPVEKDKTNKTGFSILTGDKGCRLANVVPSTLSGSFGTLSSLSTPSPLSAGAASDLVLISFIDNYGPPYNIAPGSPTYSPEIFDDQETETSCTPFGSCFVRLGLDDALPISENLAPATPTPSPIATPIACSSNAQCPSGFTCLLPTPGPGTPAPGTPAPGVCVQVITPTPPIVTPTRRPSGGGGGCSIGGPAEIGTAMANVLVPLVPAFAIGFRVLRRRSRKNQK